jgi:hypothetical protein
MRRILIALTLILALKTGAQESQGIKPGISINGYPCLIQNLIYSCVPRTCDSVIIEAGDSIEFCTFQAIELNADTAYWLRWHFYGATNLPDTIWHLYSTQTPLCHYPRWDSAGTFIAEAFYNGDLTAYPTNDCYLQGPSHWYIKVIVLPDPNGVEEKSANEITIAPNPSSGKFTLVNKTSTDQVTITDMTGRVLFHTNESEIDLTTFGCGIYFANVCSETEVSTSVLVVK